MPFEFSFVALFNLTMALGLLFTLWRATSPLLTKMVMVLRDPDADVDTSDPIGDIRWGWLLFTVLFGIFLMFNPVDFSISEQAEREKQEQMKITVENKRDIPPRVVVESRSLDKALEEFDEAVDEARVENEAEQTLNQN